MNLIHEIRKELNKHTEKAYKEGAIRFFKERINPLGVRTPTVRKIARNYFPKEAQKNEIFALCEQLLEKRTMEETLIAFAWARGMKKDFAPTDFARFERWLKKYVDNWAFCDDFCTHAFGDLLLMYPALLTRTVSWRSSKNRWLRRAAGVILIPLVKQKRSLQEVFAVAKHFISRQDQDDLVQKGYGWALKEASNIFPAKVYAFVLENKAQMPRTALRYAIEKYPKEMRKKAMQRDLHG